MVLVNFSCSCCVRAAFACREHRQPKIVLENSVACRGSWKPGANKVLGCPGARQILIFFCSEENLRFPTNFSRKMFDSSPQISNDLFLAIYQKIYNFFPKTCSIRLTINYTLNFKKNWVVG